MSFNPANFKPFAAMTEAAVDPVTNAPVATSVTVEALRNAGAIWLKRHDSFADGKADTCFDMADKLERFGSFISEKQAAYAAKLVLWTQPREQIAQPVQPGPVAAPVQKAAATLALPKLFDLMQRLSKLEIGKLRIARKNQDSLCWIKHEDSEKVVGRLNGEHGLLTLWVRPGVDNAQVLMDLLDIEKDPQAAAVLHGRASGRCSVCSRDLTDPESIERGIGPVCFGKF
jgi:hypothetical protein